MAKRSGNYNWFYTLAVVAVFLLALSLVLAYVLELIKLEDAGLIAILRQIAYGIAILITAVASYYGIQSFGQAKNRNVWFILWVIAVVIVVVAFVLPQLSIIKI